MLLTVKAAVWFLLRARTFVSSVSARDAGETSDGAVAISIGSVPVLRRGVESLFKDVIIY